MFTGKPPCQDAFVNGPLKAPGMAMHITTRTVGGRPRAGAAMGALAAALLVALPVASRGEEGLRADYLCKGHFDASEVTAFFFNGTPDVVVLLVGEGATLLPRAMSGSGARYSDGGQTFWVKGERATWQQGQAPTRNCEPRQR